MGERYEYQPNSDYRNKMIYPWVVVDTNNGGRLPVAYTVTQHTAMAYSRQLNDDGYISSI